MTLANRINVPPINYYLLTYKLDAFINCMLYTFISLLRNHTNWYENITGDIIILFGEQFYILFSIGEQFYILFSIGNSWNESHNKNVRYRV